MARYKPVSYNQALIVPVILEKQLIPGTLEFAIHQKRWAGKINRIP